MTRRHELLARGMIEHRQQMIVVAVDIENATRLAVQAELRPGQRLAELLEGTEAAGHSDEAIGQIRHHLLALMHGVDYMQMGELMIRELLAPQRMRYHTNHFAASPHRRFCDCTH